MDDTTSYESSGDGEFYDNYDDDYNDYGQPPHSYLLDHDNATTVTMTTVSNATIGLFLFCFSICHKLKCKNKL